MKKSDHIDIVFDGPPGPESGRFIEVEDSNGKSIRFGEWVKREDGYWCLRFSPKSEAERLLELLHERRGSLHCYAASRCVVDYPDSDYVTERDNPLDALRAAREASDE